MLSRNGFSSPRCSLSPFRWRTSKTSLTTADKKRISRHLQCPERAKQRWIDRSARMRTVLCTAFVDLPIILPFVGTLLIEGHLPCSCWCARLGYRGCKLRGLHHKMMIRISDGLYNRVVVLGKICTDRLCKLPLDLCFANLKLKKNSRGGGGASPPNPPHLFPPLATTKILIFRTLM